MLKRAGAITRALSKSVLLTPDLAPNVFPFSSAFFSPFFTPLLTFSSSYSVLSYFILFSSPVSFSVLFLSVLFSSVLFSIVFFSSENRSSKRIRTVMYKRAILVLLTRIVFLVYKKRQATGRMYIEMGIYFFFRRVYIQYT